MKQLLPHECCVFGLLFATTLMSGFAQSACAQSVAEINGELTASQRAELGLWSELYWQRKDQGGGSPGAAFFFTSPGLNEHLFNPLRATRGTLEVLNVLSANDCDGLGNAGFEADQATELAFRASMIDAEFTTSIAGNPTGTISHVQLILAAPADAGMTVSLDGDELKSEYLPLSKVSGEAYAAAIETNLSAATQNILSALLASSAQWAIDAGDVTEARKLITGEPSKADRFAATVAQFLALAEHSGWAPHGTLGVQRISAAFGVAGELPLVAVQLTDCYVLFSPLSGDMTGPFEQSSPLDARPLLANHGFEPANGIRYFNAAGCSTPNLAGWHTTPPPGTFTPRPPCIPVAPATSCPSPPWILPGAPNLPFHPSVPGWFQDWVCVGVPGGPGTPATECTTYGRYRDPTTGFEYFVKHICKLSCPISTQPTYPPAPGQPPLPADQHPMIDPNKPFPEPSPTVCPGAFWACRDEYLY